MPNGLGAFLASLAAVPVPTSAAARPSISNANAHGIAVPSSSCGAAQGSGASAVPPQCRQCKAAFLGSTCATGGYTNANQPEDDEGWEDDMTTTTENREYDDEEPWLDDDADEYEEEDRSRPPRTTAGVTGKRAGELWYTPEVYPSGSNALLCEENITAALQYVCPCGKKCLSRVGFIPVYEQRKAEVLAGQGKLKRLYDAAKPRYSSETKTFAAFTLGTKNDCCFAAYALASGVSNSTAVRARAHVSKARAPVERKEGVGELQSEAARHLHAHIRDICKPLENAPTVRDKKHEHEWSCSREAIKTRWHAYVQMRIALSQKVWGSLTLFGRVFKSHTEILQQRVTGHDVCDVCADLDTEEANINHRTPEGQEKLRQVQEKRRSHKRVYSASYDYFDDAV